MTFIEPVPERIRAITPPPRPDARPVPGAVQRPKAAAVRQRRAVAAPKDAVSVPEGAVSTPESAVQIPPYKDTAKIPEETTTTPPTPSPSIGASSSSSWSGQEKEEDTAGTTPQPPPSTTASNEPTIATAAGRTTSTATPTEADTPPPPAAPTATSAAPTEPLSGPALLTLLLFDFYLADLTTAQKAELCQRLARLPAPLAQTILDEYNSAVGRKVQFRNKWGWFEFLIRAALEGHFMPTSDLAERRAAQAQAQVQATTANTTVSMPPARQPSAVWEAHQEELVRLFPPNEVGINLSPLRALEDGHTLWLEAPNTFVVNWVRAHLSQIEAVLRPHIALPIRVCIRLVPE